MASTYGNDLRLEEIGDGEQSGTWGATTNTNLELIAEALSFGTEAITTNADTHTTTIADGATDPGRSLYLKYTGTLDSTCTITIAPNSISKTWYIENGTSGSQSIIISQGSGANVTIPTGQTKVVYSDGAGSGAAMAEIGTLGVTNLNVSGDITVGDDLTVTDDMTVGGTLGVTGVLTGTSLDISGNVDIDGTTNLDAVDIDGAVQVDATVNVGVDDTGYDVKFFGDTASAYMQWDASADDLILGGAAGLVVPQDKLTIASTAVTSTAAELNQLDAITRGSILYGNASGATARLAKGGADTVLTSDGTDISWAAAGGGGGEQTFTAGAAINAGDLVSIKANGTIQKTEGETSGIITISGSTPEPELLTRMSSAFDGTDKIVIVYHEHADNIVAYVGTIANGTSLSWGSKVTVSSGNKEVPDVCYDSNAGKFLVVWRNNNPGFSKRGEAAVGTVSGTSISFGSTVVYDSGGVNNVNVRYDDNAQKSMILYRNASTSVKAVVATISGTSVSFGTALTLQNNDSENSGALSLVYDNNANKFVAVYAMDTYLRSIVLTISGTSITYGSNHDFATAYPYYMQAHFNKNENKVVVVWYRDSSPSGWKAVAGSISGTSFATGTIWTTLIGGPTNGYDETAQKSYTFNDGGVYREFAFSGNNVSVLGVPTRDYAPGGVGSTIYSLGFDSYAGPKLNFFLWEYATTVSTKIESAEVLPWVGIAAENISNGATGKVTVAGGINTSVSGLTAGLTYGLPANSAAITAIPIGGDDGNRIFGTALSTTSIYIDKGTLR